MVRPVDNVSQREASHVEVICTILVDTGYPENKNKNFKASKMLVGTETHCQMLAIFKRLFNVSYMSTAVARLAIGEFNVLSFR